MGKRRAWVGISVVAALVASGGSTAVAEPTEVSEQHCVIRLVPVSYDPATNTVTERPELLGCYEKFLEAIAAGTHGVVHLPEGTEPQELTQQLYDASGGLEATAAGDVLLGEEWNETNYSGGSAVYTANTGCANHTHEAVVNDNWNDRFESGKGFGACDQNRKFAGPDFGGDSILCTPNCANYGDLRNRVSSLRWKDNN